MKMEDAGKFVRTVQVAALAITALLSVIAFTATYTLNRFDKLVEKVDEIGKAVVVQQTILMGHDKRLDRLEYEKR